MYSTPVGIPPPDVYAGRYYDMCSELQAFVDGLPEFSQTGFVVSPATDQGSVNPQHIQPATTVQFEDDVIHVPDNAMLSDDQAAKSFRIDTPLDSELLRDPHPSPADEEMITTHLVASIDPFSQAVTLTQGIDVQDPMKPPAPCRVPTSEAVTAIANLDPPSFNLERPHPKAMANSGQDACPGTPMPGLEEVTYDTQSPPYVPQSPPEQYQHEMAAWLPRSPIDTSITASETVPITVRPETPAEVQTIKCRLEMLERRSTKHEDRFSELEKGTIDHTNGLAGLEQRLNDHSDRLATVQAQSDVTDKTLYQYTLGARGGVLTQYITNTLQGNGQRT